MKKLILASSSPRRRHLLKKTGLNFTVAASNYKENLKLKKKPEELAKFLSAGKAREVARRYKDAIVIGADTLVVYRGQVLGKPFTGTKAKKMLSMLNGKMHRVITGFTIVDTQTNRNISRAVATRVYFKKLTADQIDRYIKTKEPLDKAGAYAIQEQGKSLVKKIEGDYDSVVGLPVNEVLKVLKKDFGIF